MIELAFYKGKSTRTIFNQTFTAFIKFWTQCKYSHVELVVKESDDSNTWLWSSSMDDGVRTENIKFNPDNWDFFKLPYFNAIDTLDFIDEQEGKLYDWWGIILSQLFNAKLDNRNKWFCSELIYTSLVKGKLFGGEDALKNPATISPKKLLKLIKAYV